MVLQMLNISTRNFYNEVAARFPALWLHAGHALTLGIANMRCFHAFSIATLIAFQAQPVQARPSWPIGTYVLEGAQKGDSGTLIIHSSDTKSTSFSIEFASCRKDCETDAPYVNIGVIEKDTVKISGRSGRYRSAGPDEETQAPELGICVLQFSLERHAITVTQLSTCWWFGMGVYVSGTYKLAPAHAAR